MSEISPLSELARFIGNSGLASRDELVRRRAVAHMGKSAKARPQRRSVSDLLGVVLVLSARTRRAVLPKVTVSIDVFSPGGARAIYLYMGDRD